MCFSVYGRAPEPSPVREDAAGEADAIPAHGIILSLRHQYAAEVEDVKERSRDVAF